MSNIKAEYYEDTVVFVPSELTSFAATDLQIQIDVDMSIPDPEDKENALANLVTKS